MEKERFFEKEYVKRILIFLKWIAIATALGIIIGAVGCLFYRLLEYVTDLREQNPMLLWGLPVAGIIIVFLYRICGKKESRGTNLVLLAVRSEEAIPFKMAPLIFISTLLTHLCGGSAGREGAALQLGGSIGQQVGRALKLDQKDMNIITMCGMSACFSAVFGTPIAAAIFSLEVVSVGVMYYAALVPCAVAAMVSVFISHLFRVEHAIMGIASVPELLPIPILQVLILGILCAAISFVFCKALSETGRLSKKYIKNDYLRVLAGSAIIIALTYLLGTRDYLGAGMNVISDALSGNVRPEAFLLKIIFTSITLAAAFKGGEIVPTFFIGATFGAVAGPILGLDASFAAGISMAAVFCGVTNCPITSLLIGLELFGMPAAPYLLIACAISYMLSGYTGLYSKQKILYSKFRPEFINEHAKH